MRSSAPEIQKVAWRAEYKTKKVRNILKSIDLIELFSEQWIKNEIQQNEENTRGSERLNLSACLLLPVHGKNEKWTNIYSCSFSWLFISFSYHSSSTPVEFIECNKIYQLQPIYSQGKDVRQDQKPAGYGGRNLCAELPIGS
jgi:hypothetical protein